MPGSQKSDIYNDTVETQSVKVGDTITVNKNSSSLGAESSKSKTQQIIVMYTDANV